MKRCVVWIWILMMILCLPAAAQETEIPTAPEGWSFIGYVYGGITYAVPEDYQPWELYEEETAAGIIALGGNEECTIQLRQFEEEVLTYEMLVEIMSQEPSAETAVWGEGEEEVFCYRNLNPNESSELVGVALTGTDGLLYKISIFTGTDGAFDEKAKVWEIAQILAATAQRMDFSEWGVETAE